MVVGLFSFQTNENLNKDYVNIRRYNGIPGSHIQALILQLREYKLYVEV